MHTRYDTDIDFISAFLYVFPLHDVEHANACEFVSRTGFKKSVCNFAVIKINGL